MRQRPVEARLADRVRDVLVCRRDPHDPVAPGADDRERTRRHNWLLSLTLRCRGQGNGGAYAASRQRLAEADFMAASCPGTDRAANESVAARAAAGILDSFTRLHQHEPPRFTAGGARARSGST